jgi:hypothetical protein
MDNEIMDNEIMDKYLNASRIKNIIIVSLLLYIIYFNIMFS